MTNDEPTFTINIRACSFANQTMEQLTVKLNLMHKMGLNPLTESVDEEEGEA